MIDDPALRAELRPHSRNQSQVTDASQLVGFLAKVRYPASELIQHR